MVKHIENGVCVRFLWRAQRERWVEDQIFALGLSDVTRRADSDSDRAVSVTGQVAVVAGRAILSSVCHRTFPHMTHSSELELYVCSGFYGGLPLFDELPVAPQSNRGGAVDIF